MEAAELSSAGSSRIYKQQEYIPWAVVKKLLFKHSKQLGF